jgi:hypothetical protein
VEPGQVADVVRIHDAAGILAVSRPVRPGHEAVRQLAASGTPITVTEFRQRKSVPGPGRRARSRSAGS